MSPAAMLREALSHATVSPLDELVAYEYLYSRDGMTLNKITEMTVGSDRLPLQALLEESGLFDPRDGDDYRKVERYVEDKAGTFDLAIKGTPSWPASLADSERPAPILYFRGSLSLMSMKSFSVVGSRRASREGLSLASQIAEDLAKDNKAVVTGLAAGIDTAATMSALKYGSGCVVGVIGTPIDECYPRENQKLVDAMLEEGGLIVSQVPFYRYHVQPFRTKRFYFPERNELMAAISDATIIVEASDTSGTLTQARACAHQGRPLFITKHCYDNKSLSWPKKWAQRDYVHVIDGATEALEIMDSLNLYRGSHE